jgi:hypothetical protein
MVDIWSIGAIFRIRAKQETMMRVIDYLPYVLAALKKEGPSGQGDLTVMVWGTSGRNSPKLTKSLFPSMVSAGLIAQTKKGRSITFRITEQGLAAYELAPLDPKDEEWFFKSIEDNRWE